jgi:cyclophilin family peptidyl-prolyl cis-trans isomerase/HEAT repeat protein
VRALGQLEETARVEELVPFLTHERTEVRREAANALGQSLARVPRTGEGAEPPQVALVARTLLERLVKDEDPAVRGTIAETLGRLPYRSEPLARQAEAALRDLLGLLHPDVLTGAIKGLEAWVRFNHARFATAPPTVERLRTVATLPLHRLEPSYAFIRRVAWRAVNRAAAADVALVTDGVRDADAQVRRLAILTLTKTTATDEQRRALLATALKDLTFYVRHAAVRTYGGLLQPQDCGPTLAALKDPDAHVRLEAIDQLANPCPAGAEAPRVLAEIADRLPAQGGPPAFAEASAGKEGPPLRGDAVAWHEPAHALVSLAKVDGATAGQRLPRFVQHPSWHVRAWAARAAAALRDTPTLERLAKDDNDNVRAEAVTGLTQAAGHAADAIYVDALARPDYQLVLLAAQALTGSPNRAAAVPALLRAFARLTLERRDTSRDSRMALLARLRELGSEENAGALRPCLIDVDPVVADECAATLQAWTKRPHSAVQITAPAPPPPVDDRLPNRARFVMSNGGVFEVLLLTGEAPATISRFARLARRGYYNGLTFHRVVPGFVIQGGSPGANEYSGDGPFMRDELGLHSHTRGTIGTSTRGRNTGDAQFFVNLLDNPSLDHDYTIFGEVTAGMDVVDAVLEGDVIARIELQ